MDITSLTGITSDYIEKVAEQNRLVNTSDDSFQSVLDSAMNVLSETSDLQNDAEAAQIEFAPVPACYLTPFIKFAYS